MISKKSLECSIEMMIVASEGFNLDEKVGFPLEGLKGTLMALEVGQTSIVGTVSSLVFFLLALEVEVSEPYTIRYVTIFKELIVSLAYDVGIYS